MEYFVGPSGNDDHEGKENCPFRTIRRGLQGATPGSTLQPGDVLTLQEGVYNEAVLIKGLAGEPGNEITIRSSPGQRAVIETRLPLAGAWVKASTVDLNTHPDEWAWPVPFPTNVRPTRGAFLDAPYRRLVSYTARQDFRSENRTFRKIFNVENFNPKRGPYKVTDKNAVPVLDPATKREYTYPWVYMGPGLGVIQSQKDGKRRVHVRLSHTELNIPGIEDYSGPTDPEQAGLAICDRDVVTLTITNSRYLNFSNLTVRFGGRNTIEINGARFLRFEDVEVQASTGGIRFGAAGDITFSNCRFDGGLPPWFFRTDKKAEYDYLLNRESTEALHNSLGDATVDVLMYGEGPKKENFEIAHCEFVNGHDLYLVAKNTHFHHNWIDNLHDEGLVIDSLPSANGRIHSNVITRCLSAISMAGGLTAGPWAIYRNLVDLRQPTAGKRPHTKGDKKVFRFGSAFKSNESPAGPDGPFYLFHNTFLVANQREQAAYLHYRSNQSPHIHFSFNNIFVAVNPSPEFDIPISFAPSPVLPCPTDGNLYHRYGAATHKAFRSLAYEFNNATLPGARYTDLDELRGSRLFRDSQTQYAPGYEAHSLFTDPGFRQIAADGSSGAFDDLRLGDKSLALWAAIPLPPELRLLDDAAGAPGFGPSHAIGCYRSGSGPLTVGVHGQRHFPPELFP